MSTEDRQGGRTSRVGTINRHCRGKYVTSASSASTNCSHGTSYITSVATTGVGPDLPLMYTWAASTTSPLTRDRHPCNPMVATWCNPQPAGHPDQWMLKGAILRPRVR